MSSMFAGLERLLPEYAKWSKLSRAVPSTMIVFGGGVVADDCAGFWLCGIDRKSEERTGIYKGIKCVHQIFC